MLGVVYGFGPIGLACHPLRLFLLLVVAETGKPFLWECVCGAEHF